MKAKVANAKDYMPEEEISIVGQILSDPETKKLFLPGFERYIEDGLKEAIKARDLGVPAEAQREIRRSLMHLAFMFESKEGREKVKKDSDLSKLKEEARARGQAARLKRGELPPPPAFPIFATAPPGDGGRRRRSRRGRKSRRKSLRQRK